MKKPRSDVIPLDEGEAAGSRFKWLYSQLREAVLEGRLVPGSRMASTRAVAQTYAISRGTVVAVFEQLVAEGYFAARTGSGTFVATSLPDEWTRVATLRGATGITNAEARPGLSARGRELSRSGGFVADNASRAFQAHRPAIDSATRAIWQRISARRRTQDENFFHHNDRRGFRPLRAAIADHLRTVRGVRCTEEQVLILSGVRQAVDLTTRLLTDAGDAAVVEDPGYPGVRAILAANAVNIITIPVDAEGANIDAAGPEAAHARLAFVTPAHQYPLGITLSVRRRLALLRWAARVGSYIFEDDYDGEYRFAGRPIAALQGLDENGRVIYSGTFNKVLFPALRLSYLVVPEHIVDAFSKGRATLDRYPALGPQIVLAEFIGEGHFGRHLRRMREMYAGRLAVFGAAFAARLDDDFRLDGVTTGLQTVAWLRSPINDRDVARAALARGIEVLPLSAMRVEHPLDEGLVLGFAGFDTRETTHGLDALRTVMDELRSSRRRSI